MREVHDRDVNCLSHLSWKSYEVKIGKENDDTLDTCIDQIELIKLVIKNKCSLTGIDACEIS